MAKKNTVETMVNVPAEVKTVIDIYAEADKAKKDAEGVMKANRESIIRAVTETSNNTGATTVAASGEKHSVQVQFKTSYTLNTNCEKFPQVAAAAKEGKVPCITFARTICVHPDKAAEVVAFLQALGRADLIIDTTTPVFNREVFDAMEKTPVYAERDALVACLDADITPTIKVVK